jgi:plastocyanin
MSSAPIVDRIRIIPRPNDFLDRNVGSSGEVFFNKATSSLRVYSGSDRSGFEIARADLENVSTSALTAKLTQLGYTPGGDSASITVDSSAPSDPEEGQLWFDTDTGVLFVYYTDWIQPSVTGGGTAVNTFSNILVSGESTLSALGSDSVTFIAGSNINITTNASTNTLTISANATGGEITPNSFTTFAVSGENSLTADSPTDTLTLVAGANVSITTNSATDTLTISSTANTLFTGLTDVASASLSVANVYEPASILFKVDNVSTLAYTFDSHYSGNNPTIHVITGTTVAFDLNQIPGHPFEIQNSQGNQYNEGLVHVSNTGEVSTGADAQGKDSGILYWRIKETVFGTYRYQCQSHASMVGGIQFHRLSQL